MRLWQRGGLPSLCKQFHLVPRSSKPSKQATSGTFYGVFKKEIHISNGMK